MMVQTELPCGFCPKALTTQAGGDGFDVVFRQFICQTRCTIPLFCVTECLPDSGITDQTELLASVWLMMAQPPGVPATAGHAQHHAHGFDAELCPMIFDKDILHFRRFAKYVAAFWRMASSSSRSANWR